ncbi:MAG: hypothetical protein ACRDIY_08010 [Chloroflexota bacterium]
MSKGRKPRRAVPKSKLNGKAEHVDSLPPTGPGQHSVRRPPDRPTPRPRLAMLVTAAILVVALIGIVLSTSLSDTLSTVVNGPAGGHGQVVDGIPCQNGEQLAYHVHAHLTILANGQPVTVPAQVGIPGSCFYWLHTHDTTGAIHIEAPAPQTYTLGQFFDIWGQPLTTDNVAGNRGAVTAYVNQVKVSGDPRSIPLKDHSSIVLEVGTSPPPPANFDFGDLP